MAMPHMIVAKTVVAGIAACCLLAEAPLPQSLAPLGQFAQCGMVGLSLFLVFWMIAKTLPGLVKAHGDQLNQTNETNAASIKQLADTNATNLKLFTDTVRDIAAKK